MTFSPSGDFPPLFLLIDTEKGESQKLMKFKSNLCLNGFRNQIDKEEMQVSYSMNICFKVLNHIKIIKVERLQTLQTQLPLTPIFGERWDVVGFLIGHCTCLP